MSGACATTESSTALKHTSASSTASSGRQLLRRMAADCKKQASGLSACHGGDRIRCATDNGTSRMSSSFSGRTGRSLRCPPSSSEWRTVSQSTGLPFSVPAFPVAAVGCLNWFCIGRQQVRQVTGGRRQMGHGRSNNKFVLTPLFVHPTLTSWPRSKQTRTDGDFLPNNAEAKEKEAKAGTGTIRKRTRTKARMRAAWCGSLSTLALFVVESLQNNCHCAGHAPTARTEKDGRGWEGRSEARTRR
jgi:hypothetical protein